MVNMDANISGKTHRLRIYKSGARSFSPGWKNYINSAQNCQKMEFFEALGVGSVGVGSVGRVPGLRAQS